MTEATNLEAAVQSAEGFVQRLTRAQDNGDEVTVALHLAHERLVRVKALLDQATLTTETKEKS